MMDISASNPSTVGQREMTASSRTAEVEAFSAFYGRAAEPVARALTATLGDSELAADAVNEAMTRAYQQWKKISRYDNPAAWVYRVGLNWSLSWKRRRRRERERPVQLAAARAEPIERDDSIDAALDRLTVEQRAVVVCRIHLDWSIDQTADALGIAPGTVKSRLARALGDMRAHLEIQQRKDSST